MKEVEDNLQMAFSTQLGLSATFVNSKQWYMESFTRCGDWQSWIWDTIHGRDYGSRKPHFNGYVVCENQLGRATAQIAHLALRNGKAVFHWQDRQPLTLVSRVVEVNGEDWKAGWTVQTNTIGG